MSESLKIDTPPRAASNVALSPDDGPFVRCAWCGTEARLWRMEGLAKTGATGGWERLAGLAYVLPGEWLDVLRLQTADSASRFACGSACGDRVRAVQLLLEDATAGVTFNQVRDAFKRTLSREKS